jgi:diguanylate cyclase (GGDEF)-like protein
VRQPRRIGDLRELLFNPGAAAPFFWLGGIVGAAVVLATAHWPTSSVVTTLAVMAVAAMAITERLVFGVRRTRWMTHVDPALATALVSVVLTVAPRGFTVLAIFYVWVAVSMSLYLTGRQAALQVGLVAVAYAAVLGVGPPVSQPYVAWVAVVGTCAMVAAPTSALVSLLRATALRDPLTGVANRRVFDERLEGELARARRTATPVTVVMIDIDDFKAVNDRRGHDAGDRTLVRCVEGWQSRLRGSTDLLARVGGDEFAAVLVDEDSSQVDATMARLAEVSPDDVTSSMGAATWDGTESAHDLVQRADHAMYQAKARRRGEKSR